jgi:hypothetical protein
MVLPLRGHSRLHALIGSTVGCLAAGAPASAGAKKKHTKRGGECSPWVRADVILSILAPVQSPAGYQLD